MDGYMLDTNAFNGLVDGPISPELRGATAPLYATHIQLDELSNTRSVERRTELLHMFDAIGPKQIPTEAAVRGIGKWGEAKWSDGSAYNRIFARLETLGRKDNNRHDALIAETAIKNGFTLVTNDRHLAQVCRELHGRVVTLEEFLRESIG
jgi:predicted nucleic acid-binding protein